MRDRQLHLGGAAERGEEAARLRGKRGGHAGPCTHLHHTTVAHPCLSGVVLLLQAEESKKRSEKLVDNLRAILEETDLRIAELKKEAYEFKRDIVVGAENMRTGKTVAEKIYRYMEDKLRQKDQVMEKLRLKNATLKAQIAKVGTRATTTKHSQPGRQAVLSHPGSGGGFGPAAGVGVTTHGCLSVWCVQAEHQLNQKEEMGDILHYIDFHQLQVGQPDYHSTTAPLARGLGGY